MCITWCISAFFTLFGHSVCGYLFFVPTAVFDKFFPNFTKFVQRDEIYFFSFIGLHFSKKFFSPLQSFYR